MSVERDREWEALSESLARAAGLGLSSPTEAEEAMTPLVSDEQLQAAYSYAISKHPANVDKVDLETSVTSKNAVRKPTSDDATRGVVGQSTSLIDDERKLEDNESKTVCSVPSDLLVDNKREVRGGEHVIGEKYDVFLCHNSEDKPAVRTICRQLQGKGLKPWLDEEQLRPGLPWQRALEEQIKNIDAAAVFVGPSVLGPWQEMETEAFLSEFVKRNCPVIPVILPGCGETPTLPVFLRGMTWVDFRQHEPNPIKQLVWGITSMP